MKKIKVKARAKINLTLDVLGVEQNYHTLNMLVSTIDLHDTIIIKKRKDNIINLKMKGLPVDSSMVDNNAYKSAKLFMQTFGTYGVDIIIDKKIPVAGGLGGSSADIAGVLNGMKKLFEKRKSVLPLANALGSDSGYLLTGGYALLSGRGEKIKPIDIDKKFYLLILTENTPISAKESYKTFDKQNKTYLPCTKVALKAIEKKDYSLFFKALKNDLYPASLEILPKLKDNISAIKETGADAVLMTGSGSAVYGLFESKAKRNKAYKKLLSAYKGQLIKAETN